jgi:hypothetical protein
MKFPRLIVAALAIIFAVAITDRASAQASVSMWCWNPSGSNATNNQYTPCNSSNPLVVSASVSASISGFPGASPTTGAPISVTTAGVTGTLPAGSVVVASNVGSTNIAYCKLGASATVNDQPISPNGGWFAFTTGGATQLTCITSTSTTTVNMVGGAGLPTGAGGGSSGGSGSNASVSATGSAVPSSATYIGIISGGNLTGWTGAVTQVTAANLNATVVGTGTFATQSAITAASGSISAGAISAGAYVSGSVLSGAYASGALVDITNVSTPISPNTATATKGLLIGGQFNSTQETLTNGQQGQVALSSRGALFVATGADVFNVANAGTFVAQVNGFTSWAGGTLGAMANYGTSPGAVLVPGVNSFVTNTVAANATLQSTPTTAIGKVDPNTINSWGLQVSTQNSATPTNVMLIGGQFNTSPTTITSGNMSPLQLDNSGRVIVNCASGCGGSGGTSSAFGSAFPATGTAIGLTNGTNMVAWSAASNYGTSPGAIAVPAVNASVTNSVTVAQATASNLNVTCANCSGSGASGTDEANFTAGSSVFAPSGGFFQTTATNNPLTTGQWGTVQMTAQRAFFINLRNASGTEIGTSTTPLVDTARVVGNTGAVMDAAGQNVSAPANWLQAGCQFNTSPTTITSGNGSPCQMDSAGNILVNVKTATGLAQGSTTSGQTGSLVFGAVTTGNPSYTTAQSSPLSLDTAGGLRIAGEGTAGTATGGVVSIQGVASMTPVASNITQVLGSALSATNGLYTNLLQGNAVLSVTNPAFTEVTDGSHGAANTKAASTPAAATDIALVVDQRPGTGDACNSAAAKSGAAISLTASGQVITGTASKKTYICSIDLVSATAQNIALVEGTGTTCATNIFGLAGGTTAATGWNFAANGGLTKGSGSGTVYSPSADTNGTAANVCLLLSGTGQTSGQITYVQQ